MRTLFVLLALLLPAPARGQEAIKIVEAARIANTGDGVCWFACVETLGYHFQIRPLYGLVGKVRATGVGKGGATPEAIAHWLKETGVRALPAPGDGDPAFLLEALKRGLPVVSTLRHWERPDTTHAVLLAGVTAEAEVWKRTGERDRIATLYDPNDVSQEFTYPWGRFLKLWTGQAFVIDPRAQDPRTLGPPPLRPGRLMTDGRFHLEKPVDPAVLAKVQTQVRAFTTQSQGVMPPHELPFTTQHPVQHGPVKVPSNQDIKDGVTRPSDVLFNFCYPYHQGYDYFSAARKGAPPQQGGR